MSGEAYFTSFGGLVNQENWSQNNPRLIDEHTLRLLGVIERAMENILMRLQEHQANNGSHLNEFISHKRFTFNLTL